MNNCVSNWPCSPKFDCNLKQCIYDKLEMEGARTTIRVCKNGSIHGQSGELTEIV